MLELVVLERTLGLFALAQIIHVVWWRVRRPAGYLYWFTAVWAIGFAFAVCLWVAGCTALTGAFDEQDALQWFGAFVGYIALCGAYVMIYPAITDLSPSLEILRALRAAPGGARDFQSLKALPVIAAHRVAYRVDNLRSSRLAISDGGSLRLTPFGNRIARVIDAYRRLIGIPRRAGG